MFCFHQISLVLMLLRCISPLNNVGQQKLILKIKTTAYFLRIYPCNVFIEKSLLQNETRNSS